MSEIKNFIEKSLEFCYPVNFTKMKLQQKKTLKEEKNLLSKRYETKEYSVHEFHKPISIFIKYNSLESYNRENR